jgi:hypothetical protein
MTEDLRPRHLIGGYATDTLEPEEQEILYRAALSDQDVFDDLAEEQEQRELLRDDALRARVRDILEPSPGRPRFLARYGVALRRTGYLAAASLVAGLSLVVWRSQSESVVPEHSEPSVTRTTRASEPVDAGTAASAAVDEEPGTIWDHWLRLPITSGVGDLAAVALQVPVAHLAAQEGASVRDGSIGGSTIVAFELMDKPLLLSSRERLVLRVFPQRSVNILLLEIGSDGRVQPLRVSSETLPGGQETLIEVPRPAGHSPLGTRQLRLFLHLSGAPADPERPPEEVQVLGIRIEVKPIGSPSQ